MDIILTLIVDGLSLIALVAMAVTAACIIEELWLYIVSKKDKR